MGEEFAGRCGGVLHCDSSGLARHAGSRCVRIRNGPTGKNSIAPADGLFQRSSTQAFGVLQRQDAGSGPAVHRSALVCRKAPAQFPKGFRGQYEFCGTRPCANAMRQ